MKSMEEEHEMLRACSTVQCYSSVDRCQPIEDPRYLRCRCLIHTRDNCAKGKKTLPRTLHLKDVFYDWSTGGTELDHCICESLVNDHIFNVLSFLSSICIFSSNTLPWSYPISLSSLYTLTPHSNPCYIDILPFALSLATSPCSPPSRRTHSSWLLSAHCPSPSRTALATSTPSAMCHSAKPCTYSKT